MIDWLILSKRDKQLPLPIYQQLLARLYEAPRIVMLAAAVCIAGLGSLAALRAQDPALWALTGVACCCVLLRLVLVWRAPSFLELSYLRSIRAELLFWISAVGSSAAVGLLGARGIHASDSEVVHLLALALAMATMAIALRNYFRPRLVVVQLATIVIPTSAALLARDEREYWALAVGAFALSYMIARMAYGLSSDAQNAVRKDRELSEQNARFEAALNNMAHGLCMFDSEARLLVCNARYLQLYNMSPDIVRPGIELKALLQHSVDVGNHLTADIDQLQDSFLDKVVGAGPNTFWNELRDGRTIAVSHEPMRNGGWVLTHEDITERRTSEAKIAYLARHDALTGLPNRVAFGECLSNALKMALEDKRIGVLCLDLDRFKIVNDTLGHPVGDALLQQVAERLRTCVRRGDTIARIGGDEFALIQITGNGRDSAAGLAKRIVSVLQRPFLIGEHQLSIGCSVGISIAPDDSLDAEKLLKNADLALYEAKAGGRGQHKFFVQELDRRVQDRRALELDLRRALSNGEFQLHFQPIVRAADAKISGFEALLRWNEPSRGIVEPAGFVPLAEELGLIVPLGDWVLRQACAEATAWPEHIRVCVNLSPAQFRAGDLLATVTGALARSGLRPSRLELEITEGVMLEDTEATLRTLHSLRELGVRFAMDDFGTGYSSLSYLRAFPFDKIKIDQSFVQDMGAGAQALSIVRAAIDLGKNLGMLTTAEGIETVEQFDRVRAEGCSEAQGFLLGKPTDATGVGELLDRTLPGFRLLAA